MTILLKLCLSQYIPKIWAAVSIIYIFCAPPGICNSVSLSYKSGIPLSFTYVPNPLLYAKLMNQFTDKMHFLKKFLADRHGLWEFPNQGILGHSSESTDPNHQTTEEFQTKGICILTHIFYLTEIDIKMYLRLPVSHGLIFDTF